MDPKYNLVNDPTVYEILVALKDALKEPFGDGILIDSDLREKVLVNGYIYYLSLGELIKEGLVISNHNSITITKKAFTLIEEFGQYLSNSSNDDHKILAEMIKKEFFD